MSKAIPPPPSRDKFSDAPPPPKRAPGRPTDKPLTASIKARVSADEHATYMALGGSAWLRKQIELHQDEVKHGSR